MVATDSELELEPTLDVGESHPDTAPAASVELFDDFEQARMLAHAHEALFGESVTLRIGRYRVERQLGAGGMGEVYLAHDDELERKVAIKRVLELQASSHQQARLRREAQALARLHHENVVQVHEISEHEGQHFVVMQYVEGQTLADFLAGDPPRPWREVLALFLAAGRGLAAAHDEGLVHRDFKPENVLLGEGSEVRVADFGLVASAGAKVELQAGGPPGPNTAPSSLETRLSVSGAVMGTVRYMSPEQALGGSVDARSDQFSFCVALYEGLWGRPPFPLDSVVTRFEALAQSEPTAPPATRIPAAIWRVVRRGLAREPGQRWPDMNSLLAALEHVPRRRRIGAWATAATATLGLGFGLTLAWAQPPSEPCRGLDRQLAGIWDGEQREGLAARFEAGTSAHLEASRERVLAGLDRWAQAWVGEREALCQASQTQAVTASVEHLRDTCLTRQQHRVAGLVELLAEASEAELARAVEAVDALPDPGACQTELALLGVEPAAPAIAERVERLRAALAETEQLRRLGRVDEALERGLAIDEQARTLDYGPLIAEARDGLARAELVGGSHERSIELLGQAIDHAEAERHDRLAESLWTELALRLSTTQRDFEAGTKALRRAEVAARRAESGDTRLAAKRSFVRARLARAEGRDDDALLALREAIELGPAQDRPHYRLSLALWTSEPDAALDLHRRALAEAEEHFGPNHPQVATFALELGSALRRRERHDEAIAPLERAVALWTQAHAKPHRELALAEQVLAELALAAHRVDEAKQHAARVADIRATILPADHPEHGETELLLATIASLAGQTQRARAHAERAIAIWAPTLAPTDPGLIRARIELAQRALAEGELDLAAEQFALIIAHGSPQNADEAALGLVELELLRAEPDAAALALDALDARLAREQRTLGWMGFTHALLWAITDLRRGQLGPARVEALATANCPFTPEQLGAWLDDLGLDARDRARLGLT